MEGGTELGSNSTDNSLRGTGTKLHWEALGIARC